MTSNIYKPCRYIRKSGHICPQKCAYMPTKVGICPQLDFDMPRKVGISPSAVNIDIKMGIVQGGGARMYLASPWPGTFSSVHVPGRVHSGSHRAPNGGPAGQEIQHFHLNTFILDSYWIHILFILDSYWIHIGFTLDPYWIHIGFILDF